MRRRRGWRSRRATRSCCSSAAAGGGEPLIYSVNAIDRRLVDGALSDHDWTGSVIALLARLGARVVSSTAAISAGASPRAPPGA